jgi:hypothetical protein
MLSNKYIKNKTIKIWGATEGAGERRAVEKGWREKRAVEKGLERSN